MKPLKTCWKVAECSAPCTKASIQSSCKLLPRKVESESHLSWPVTIRNKMPSPVKSTEFRDRSWARWCCCSPFLGMIKMNGTAQNHEGPQGPHTAPDWANPANSNPNSQSSEESCYRKFCKALPSKAKQNKAKAKENIWNCCVLWECGSCWTVPGPNPSKTTGEGSRFQTGLRKLLTQSSPQTRKHCNFFDTVGCFYDCIRAYLLIKIETNVVQVLQGAEKSAQVFFQSRCLPLQSHGVVPRTIHDASGVLTKRMCSKTSSIRDLHHLTRLTRL